MFVIGSSGMRPGFTGAFIQSLVVDAAFAYTRMMRSPTDTGHQTRSHTEWEIYTNVLARFLDVEPAELRDKLIDERSKCRDLRQCSDRIFAWAYGKQQSW